MNPYYSRDGIEVYHGDCLDVLPTLEAVDHVITDPPYSAQTHVGARSLKSDKRAGGDGSNAGRIAFASIEAADIRRAFELCAPKRWLIATVDWRHVKELEDCPPVGMRFVRHGVWVKPDGAPQFTGDRPATGWESVAILHSLGDRMQWNGGGNRAVWIHNIAREAHPTAKPLGLVKQWIEQFTDPGDLILDPFAGSLTTLVAAHQLGRRAIGIELSKEYIDAGIERLRQGVLL